MRGHLGAEAWRVCWRSNSTITDGAPVRGHNACRWAAGATEEISQPLLRHQDEAMYFRQEGESYGIGNYNHEPLLVDADEILDHEDAPVMPSETPFTPQHFERAMKAAHQLLPGLKGTQD